MAPQPLTVTPELLQRAWQRRPRHWPDSVEACLADPIYRGLLRAAALGLAQADRRAAALAAAGTTPQPTPAAAPAPAPTPAPAARPPAPAAAPFARPAQAGLFDPKRLAAGDTDDDDD